MTSLIKLKGLISTKYVKYIKNSFSHQDIMKVNQSYQELPLLEKSEHDKKQYKTIKLNNGLVACLISDMAKDSNSFTSLKKFTGNEDNVSITMQGNKQTMSAAALCVRAGSFNDPQEVPGLAHFLEHMVFMGSEKYPGENDFESFIGKHGGFTNASTNGETTTFYFECLNKHFEQSLDRFSQFFISPLINKSSIARERVIVDSEFQMVLSKDAYRKEQMLFNLINPNIPINSFSWGNLKTLKNPNISDDKMFEMLHEFRKKHYCANRMTLALQSNLTLDEMVKLVLKYFSAVPNYNNKNISDISQYVNRVFDNPQFAKMYYMEPLSDIHQVDITWALPPTIHLYKSKPLEYICSLLGHEGKYSLLSYLKNKIWAFSLIASVSQIGQENCSLYCIFTITIVLTENGRTNIEKVIEAVFAYIKLLKENGPQELFYKELKQIQDTSFKFYEEKEAAEIVEDLVMIMQYYPPQHYFKGPLLFFEYDSNLIKETIELLDPKTMNIVVLSPQLPKHLKKFDNVEPWFQTMYSVEDFSPEFLKSLTEVSVPSHFRLPEPNIFITEDFKLYEKTTKEKIPIQLMNSNKCELWFKQDNVFLLPLACYYFNFIMPFILNSPKNACLIDLYLNILMLHLMEDTYPAFVADLSYIIDSDDENVTIAVQGYNNKLPELINLICHHIKDFINNLKSEIFEVVKLKQEALYYNQTIKTPTLLREIRILTISDKFWTSLDKYCCIEDVTYSDLIEFSNKLFAESYVQVLIMGNVTENIAITTTNQVLETLNCKGVEKSLFFKNSTVKIPPGEKIIRVESLNVNDNSTVITNYYQMGPTNNELNVMIQLLMMMIEEPLFDTLRTKLQLGYHVYNQIRDTNGILGYTITVHSQADKFEPTYIDKKIEEFLSESNKKLNSWKESKFEEYKKNFIKIKSLNELHLEEEADKYWIEIVDREYKFERNLEEINAIKNISFVNFKKWCAENIKNFRKISFQVIGHNFEAREQAKEELKFTQCSTRCTLKNKKCAKMQDNNIEYKKTVLRLRPALKYLNDSNVNCQDKKEPHFFINDIESFKKHCTLYPQN